MAMFPTGPVLICEWHADHRRRDATGIYYSRMSKWEALKEAITVVAK